MQHKQNEIQEEMNGKCNTNKKRITQKQEEMNGKCNTNKKNDNTKN